MTTIGTVATINRYPVKSMLGESLQEAALDAQGVAGDRAYAVVDTSDGKVASAKQPHKWRRLLELTAAFVDAPASGAPVKITFPDGTSTRTDDPNADATLSRFIGRDVTLAATPPPATMFEEVWPDDVGEIAPEEAIASSETEPTEAGERVSAFPVSMLAPPGRFFDLCAVHLLTTSTLDALRKAEPTADFDVRRYRPNVLVDTTKAGFVENEWPGHELEVGTTAIRIDLPTMRCVMTTLAQPGMEADRDTLRTIARVNRVEIPNMGVWACAGAYGSPVRAGTVRVGDAVNL